MVGGETIARKQRMSRQDWKCLEKERIGREKVKRFFADNYRITLTDAPLSKPYDLFFWHGKRATVIETKDRNYKSTDYDEWMINASKYDELLSHSDICDVWYANTFTDGVCMVWDMAKASVTRECIECAKYTVNQSEGTENKERVLFPVSESFINARL